MNGDEPSFRRNVLRSFSKRLPLLQPSFWLLFSGRFRFLFLRCFLSLYFGASASSTSRKAATFTEPRRKSLLPKAARLRVQRIVITRLPALLRQLRAKPCTSSMLVYELVPMFPNLHHSLSISSLPPRQIGAMTAERMTIVARAGTHEFPVGLSIQIGIVRQAYRTTIVNR